MRGVDLIEVNHGGLTSLVISRLELEGSYKSNQTVIKFTLTFKEYGIMEITHSVWKSCKRPRKTEVSTIYGVRFIAAR